MVREIGLDESELGQVDLVDEMGTEAPWSKAAEVGLGP